MPNQFLLTAEGLEKIKQEFDLLVNGKRPECVKRVAAAREQGDLSENSEYAAAREELSFIDGRILELEEIIHNAKLISHQHSKSAVDMGCQVTLHVDSRKDVFTIVGEWEADPKQKKISHSSPLGKALMGKRVGDEIEVQAPAGKLRYKILHIE
ncbi:MAG: Transcription elongation factor GreA [Candidatus Gottesmanbacteria bacterium GW2011_GWB1_43_11]|uniref:Transcription elongation factor GreA n=1 Tax=Candidatus Gottesmanbacteria bacterium GW2011_GWB1_43_11 TaxID=1618446 RepID=A0A0G1EWC4_9BACT|nr:MAG: Transcription elongation factor GreA [Candidatus Gottesmanbacteria bacterium GW2011_GWA2_42_16]KKS53302.1 MAG: Transcription elongation factor GreA [Candidatus Gottesmanbacteria bacterium GW2011_GWA1_42_26]KKS81334.1 MAG: Transcription elongation factor GreA [Candidatus Gottesmanbacteria bacterium GW2011_GWC1_43_10]KKS87321.1 MAG: Transcription elongation factor GreA [Candidatus Gottesmanbacteria bacterium GW2011_GWB1_43_11]OGG25082.1 MAG: transcription elongation factor GreA [Candidatu